MIIENMRFAQLEDGRTEVKFRCDRCNKLVDRPAFVKCYYKLLKTEFICNECVKGMEAERRRAIEAEEERRKNMTLCQKFVEFWKG